MNPHERDRNYEIPFVLLPEAVFDCAEGQTVPTAGTGGFESSMVLLPTFECDCSQPEPRADAVKPKDADQPPEQDKKSA